MQFSSSNCRPNSYLLLVSNASSCLFLPRVYRCHMQEDWTGRGYFTMYFAILFQKTKEIQWTHHLLNTNCLILLLTKYYNYFHFPPTFVFERYFPQFWPFQIFLFQNIPKGIFKSWLLPWGSTSGRLCKAGFTCQHQYCPLPSFPGMRNREVDEERH